jgi:hypothetical protein
MAIQYEDLLNEKAGKFGASATAVDFAQKAMDSCNYTLDDIRTEVGISVDRIDTNEDTIALDQQRYQGCISMGMDYYLCMLIQYQVQSLQVIEKAYREKLKATRRAYLMTQDVHGPKGDLT